MNRPPKCVVLTIMCMKIHNFSETRRPSNFTPMYMPKKNEDTCPHKALCTSGHRSTIHNSQRGNNANVYQSASKCGTDVMEY